MTRPDLPEISQVEDWRPLERPSLRPLAPRRSQATMLQTRETLGLDQGKEINRRSLDALFLGSPALNRVAASAQSPYPTFQQVHDLSLERAKSIEDVLGSKIRWISVMSGTMQYDPEKGFDSWTLNFLAFTESGHSFTILVDLNGEVTPIPARAADPEIFKEYENRDPIPVDQIQIEAQEALDLLEAKVPGTKDRKLTITFHPIIGDLNPARALPQSIWWDIGASAHYAEAMIDAQNGDISRIEMH